MTINSNYNFGLLSSGGSSLKEIQFTVTSDGVTISKSAVGYNLTYTNTDAKGLYLTSTLGQAFIVFIFPSGGTLFRPYLVKNGDDIGEINDNAIYTIKVPSNYNTVYFPGAAQVTSATTCTFLILD